MKYVHLVWAGMWRKWVRTLLTVLSIAVAFLLYGLLSALNYAFQVGSQVARTDRLVTIHKVSLIQPLPISYMGRIQAIQGVTDVTHADWFGGYYQEPRNQFAQFPVDPEPYLNMYPELVLPDEQREAWLRNRGSAIVGKSIADRYDFKVGDRIPIQATIWPKADGGLTWEFDIAGIFESTDPAQADALMLFHYDYFNEARQFGRGLIGWYIVRYGGREAAEVIADIDKTFDNSPAETRSSTESAFSADFAKQFGNIKLIVSSVLGAVFFTILLVAGNTMAQSVRERIPELAVMKTIGFTDVTVLVVVLAEALGIALFGGLIGLVFAMLMVGGIAENAAAYLPGIHYSGTDIGIGFAIMIGVGIAAGIFPGLQAKRLTIIEALGRH